MPRVLYHNALDILSMVALSTRLINLFGAPQAGGDNGGPDAGDLLALGKWYDDLGQTADAEAALRSCLEAQPDPATRSAALHRLGQILKRFNRREEAISVWKVLSESKTWEGIEACVELAKHFEWRAADLNRAATYTRKALATARKLPTGVRERVETELAHRMNRLDRKR
jgi:tetratricopeptide (TPR) repeat protein